MRARSLPADTAGQKTAELLREMKASWQSLPWQELSPDAQSKIKAVIAGNPLFHRMTQQTVYADHEIYQFLLRHPTVVIGFWEQLGSTQLSLQEHSADRYILRENGGTAAAVEVLYRTDELTIVFVRGEYRGPLLAKAYQGNALLILRTQQVYDETNEPMIVCDLDTFVQISNLGADVLAKLFFPALTKVADNNFEVTISFVSQVSKATAYNLDSLKSTADEISSLRPEVIEEFCEIADRASLRFAQRNRPTRFVAEVPAERATGVGMERREMASGSVSTLPAETPRNEVAVYTSTYSSTLPEHWEHPDWGRERLIDTPLPPYTAIRYQNSGVLSAPKPLVSNPSRHIVPRLPRGL